MSLHLQRDLDQLKREILQLGSMVEVAINKSIMALHERRIDIAKEVFDGEQFINQKEVVIEENCLKILALHQPVAVDLRFIVVILKVNNDLERMGDFAVNIAKRAATLAELPTIAFPTEFSNTMPKTIQTMVKNCLDALVRLDVDTAQSVIILDDEVDDINRNMYVKLRQMMESKPETIEAAIELLSCSRYLERTADLATNIAEDVIFMVNGEVVRHQSS